MNYIQKKFDNAILFGYEGINLMLKRKLTCGFHAHAAKDAEHPDLKLGPGALFSEVGIFSRPA